MALDPNDLVHAILAMDAYNRGSDPSIEIPNSPYSVIRQSPPSDSEDSGFSATAYTVNGTAVIAFRGMNSGSFWDLFDDAWNGWGVGAGSPEGKQAELAIQFYQSVRDQGHADIVLTGHSQGGGLAGLDRNECRPTHRRHYRT